MGQGAPLAWEVGARQSQDRERSPGGRGSAAGAARAGAAEFGEREKLPRSDRSLRSHLGVKQRQTHEGAACVMTWSPRACQEKARSALSRSGMRGRCCPPPSEEGPPAPCLRLGKRSLQQALTAAEGCFLSCRNVCGRAAGGHERPGSLSGGFAPWFPGPGGGGGVSISDGMLSQRKSGLAPACCPF